MYGYKVICYSIYIALLSSVIMLFVLFHTVLFYAERVGTVNWYSALCKCSIIIVNNSYIFVKFTFRSNYYTCYFSIYNKDKYWNLKYRDNTVIMSSLYNNNNNNNIIIYLKSNVQKSSIDHT